MVISVTGFTAARAQAIEDEAIVDGEVDIDGDLILHKFGGGEINAGNVIGPSGPAGSGLVVCTSGTRPSSPDEGTMIWETDTNRIYVWPGSSWRWVWSANGENKVRKQVSVGSNVDATGDATWPSDLEISVDIPPWATRFEAYALIGQAHQVTAQSNTQLTLVLGAGVVAGKRIRWQTLADDNERDIIIMGDYDCEAIAGSTVLFRLNAQRVSGTGALRVDAESVCYITGEFFDEP